MPIDLQDHQRGPAAAMLDAWESKKAGIYLSGDTGTGKTYLAKALMTAIAVGRSIDVLTLNAIETGFEALAAMNKAQGARSAWELIQEVKTKKAVLIDDAGRERGEYGRDLIFSLIDQTRGFLIITSNKSKKDLADLYGGDEGLRSRLSALVTIESTGPNLRKA